MSDQIYPFAAKIIVVIDNCPDDTELGCVDLIVMCHTCGCAWTLDVEASQISMSGSGSSSSSSCCSVSSSSGMTTTGFTCFASAAACRKLGGA